MKLTKRFTAKLRRSPTKGGLVKILGTVDGCPLRSAFMAMGDGTHMLPIKASIRKKIGKEAGDRVTIRLQERLDR